MNVEDAHGADAMLGLYPPLALHLAAAHLVQPYSAVLQRVGDAIAAILRLVGGYVLQKQDFVGLGALGYDFAVALHDADLKVVSSRNHLTLPVFIYVAYF